MRPSLQILALLTISAVLVCGCKEETSPAPPPAPPAPVTPASAADLAALVEERGSLTFLSNNGEWIGGDTDKKITFLPDGQIHLFQYGEALSAFRGTYTVDDHGIVTANFPSRQVPWPSMVLQQDATSLLLTPQRQAPIRFPQAYRPIPAEDEAAMRKEIEARGAK